MYERFTDRARKVLQLANQEALRFNHEYIGTEHILLGLVKEGSGVAANVLKNLDIDLRKARLEVEKCVQLGPDVVSLSKLPQTPRTKKVIEYSIEEARNLDHNYVGTEHLLLGLIREQEGVASMVLMNLGLKLEDVRDEILNLLGHPPKIEIPDLTPEVADNLEQSRLLINDLIYENAELRTLNDNQETMIIKLCAMLINSSCKKAVCITTGSKEDIAKIAKYAEEVQSETAA